MTVPRHGGIADRVVEIFREDPGRDFSADELARRCNVCVGHIHNAMSEIRARGLYPRSVRVYRLTPGTQEKLRADKEHEDEPPRSPPHPEPQPGAAARSS